MLVELERTLPEGFADLARNAEFRSLVDGLGGADTRARLHDKFHRGRSAAGVGESDGVDDVEVIADGSNLRGRRILWVDDRPASNARLAERLMRRGADVVTARDDDEAATRVATVDLLISDIGRGSNRSAGFDELARLREERTYDGPAIFFTSFVTQARREQARALRAEITDQPGELMTLAARLLEETSPAPPSRPSRDGAILISYRRADSAGYAGRLGDFLADRFGADRVLLDIDSLHRGVSFVDAVRTQLEAVDVVLVIIGPQWLSIRGSDESRRIDDQADIVRHEIATALALGKLVIPVLVGDATMPSRAELPPDIAELADRNALVISDASWMRDGSLLVKILTDELGSQHRRSR